MLFSDVFAAADETLVQHTAEPPYLCLKVAFSADSLPYVVQMSRSSYARERNGLSKHALSGLNYMCIPLQRHYTRLYVLLGCSHKQNDNYPNEACHLIGNAVGSCQDERERIGETCSLQALAFCIVHVTRVKVLVHLNCELVTTGVNHSLISVTMSEIQANSA